MNTITDFLEVVNLRILHVTDLHFNKQQCSWVLNESEKADVVCLTGDFLDTHFNQAYSITAQIEWLQSWLKAFKVPIFVCTGNHDEMESSENMHWLSNISGVRSDGCIEVIEQIRFGCIPYEFEAFEHFRSCDVLLHHEPPSSLKVSKQSGQDFGSDSLRTALKNDTLKPKWILCGHVHKPIKNVSKFKGVIISNPGANQNCSIPNHHWITLNKPSV
ncbi:hypothetical protein A9267_10870 [Shewanella sp. UCD-FRSSP16_17]|nr:hypothetical protein A9267_10870 [Shewanella sp. UCD-FRSSP16_17]